MLTDNPYTDGEEEIAAAQQVQQDVVRLGREYEGLVATPAWRHFVSQMGRIRDALIRKLILPSEDQIGYLRGQIRTLEQTMMLPQHMIDRGHATEKILMEGA